MYNIISFSYFFQVNLILLNIIKKLDIQLKHIIAECFKAKSGFTGVCYFVALLYCLP